MNWKFGEYGWRLLPGSITALMIAGLFKLSALQPLEQIAYQTLFRIRGEILWDDRVVVVAIDDASIRHLGRFPWSRQTYIPLLNRLTQADASVVGVDLLWSEASRDDAQLAEVIAQQGGVILAEAWDVTGLSLQPVASLRDAAIATGHIMTREESDGLIRTITPQVQGVPAFSVATVRAYSLVQASVPIPALDRPLWINWSGRVDHLTQYSFVEVMQGKIPLAQFRDKIVLIGVTATGIDPLMTPFNRDPPVSHIHLHAAVVNNLLQQNFLHPLSPNWLWLILLLGGPGLSLVMTGWSTQQQLVAMTGLCFGWGVVSLLLLKATLLIPTATPIVLFSLTGLAIGLSERLRENLLLQQKIEQLWQSYHHDIVMHATEAPHPLIRAQGQALLQPTISLLRVGQLTALAEQFGRSQSTQAAIARSLSIGLLAAELDGRVWFCNPVAANWLHIQVGDDLHKHLVPEWFSQSEWQSTLAHLTTEHCMTAKECYWHDRWLELKLEPLLHHPVSVKAGSTELDGVLVLVEDITPRKQIEKNLNRQIQELHQIGLLKDDFLSTVSHELRAPMANIKMAIHLLKIAQSETQRQQYLQILQDECNRETELINDLLDLQRLEAGTKNLKLETFRLQDWLPQVIEPFYPRAGSRQQSLRLHLAQDLPLLTSDQPSLGRLLTELINNACKYTPPQQSITVTARVVFPYLEVQVQNSGVSIPEAELPKIFEKFYRIPSSDRWKQGGTGLGLALVKKLVEHLGGNIQVESGSECTTFTVQLPITKT